MLAPTPRPHHAAQVGVSFAEVTGSAANETQFKSDMRSALAQGLFQLHSSHMRVNNASCPDCIRVGARARWGAARWRAGGSEGSASLWMRAALGAACGRAGGWEGSASVWVRAAC